MILIRSTYLHLATKNYVQGDKIRNPYMRR